MKCVPGRIGFLLLSGLTVGLVWASLPCGWAEDTVAPPKSDAVLHLKLRDTPLKLVLEEVFKGSGFSYSVDPTVADKLVSADLNTTMEYALRAIAATADVDIRPSGSNVYTIGPKKARPPVPIASTTEPQTVSDTPEVVVTERHVEKIPLSFVDAHDMSLIFGGVDYMSRAAQMSFSGGFSSNPYHPGMGGVPGYMKGGNSVFENGSSGYNNTLGSNGSTLGNQGNNGYQSNPFQSGQFTRAF